MCCVLIDIHVFSFACFSQKVFSLFLFRSFASRFFLSACMCSWPSRKSQSPNATTHLRSHISLAQPIALTLPIIARCYNATLIGLCLTHTCSLTLRSIFYMFSFFLFLCVSSFIDYLNVTTKLDISTSNNKLGLVFFFLMCVCGFPFILNISLFFKRLKMRRFPSFAIFS